MRANLFALVSAAALVLVASSASAQPAPSAYSPPPGTTYAAPPPVSWAPPDAGAADGTARRSPAMMVVGYTMAGVGLSGIVTGAVMIATAPNLQYEAVCAQAGCQTSGSARDPFFVMGGIAALATGGVLVAVGLPVGIIGSQKPEEASRRAQLVVGPGSAQLRWSF